ncbi:MAG: hypothetical protein ABJA64_02195 [Candidatus Saccharibacteria bacterium]
MKRSFLQRIIPFAFILVILILIIAAITAVVRVVFNNNAPTTSVVDTSSVALLSTTAEHKVRMTVRGPIVGNEQFRSYQVTVTPDSRDFVRYSGYLDQPLVSKHYGNNVKAYDEFVHALSKANLNKGAALTGDADDTRGICATGQVLEFEIISGDTVTKRLWTSTCKASPGSLATDSTQLRVLFLAQVPDANNYIGKN